MGMIPVCGVVSCFNDTLTLIRRDLLFFYHRWRMGRTANMDEATFLNTLKMTVEHHGCSIVDVDLDNHIINLDGPVDAVNACAQAIAELVGE